MKLITQLNRQQHKYLIHALDLIKRKEVFHHFVSGGSGFGKSHLIKAVKHTIDRYLETKIITII
jgi:chromosomal replication initiation ATPase DnaA